MKTVGWGVLFSSYFILFAFQSLGAVPSNPEAQVKVQGALAVLAKPYPVREKYIRENTSTVYPELKKIAFQPDLDMRVRWKALGALTLLPREKTMGDFVKAVQHREWFMRNAGLLSLERVHKEEASRWARRLLQDRSLVVRTAAVEVIHRLNDVGARHQLWNELWHARNWKRGRSLWIRPVIAKALSDFTVRGDEREWMRLLGEPQEQMNLMAIESLEKLTGTKLGQADDLLSTRVALWQKWWSTRRSL